MNKIAKILTVAALAVIAVSCASPKKMAEMAENVLVQCQPEVLEVIGGSIDADITVSYPADYFNPKAILEVTPVIVYEGGEAKMDPFMYQGEKVKDNYKVVAKAGGTVKEKVHFDYVPGMEKCYLELRGVASIKTKSVDLPSKKVADGANTTYMLVDKAGKVDFKADNYQEIIPQTEEGQILYTINSSEVRGKELKSQSIKDFQAALDEIKDNERKTLMGTEVVAYASPDGGESLNAKLSDKRAGTAEKAFNKVTKGKETGETDVQSIGQDWEGFQELVAASDIEDKDLIIRVLSMYSDPAVREQEIKNMSSVFTELKKEVLPELRRARFIANVEYKNYTSEELLQLIDENDAVLDEEALLRTATLVDNASDKLAIYKKAVDKFGSSRAQYNIAAVNLAENNLSAAKTALAKCDAQDADVLNAKGVIALREENYSEAYKYFTMSGNQTAIENEAVIDILNGAYPQAAQKLANSDCCFNKALSQVLTDDLAAASSSLKCECPKASYLKAIIAARQGKTADANALLEKAKACDCLAARAEKDIEFANCK